MECALRNALNSKEMEQLFTSALRKEVNVFNTLLNIVGILGNEHVICDIIFIFYLMVRFIKERRHYDVNLLCLFQQQQIKFSGICAQ